MTGHDTYLANGLCRLDWHSGLLNHHLEGLALAGVGNEAGCRLPVAQVRCLAGTDARCLGGSVDTHKDDVSCRQQQHQGHEAALCQAHAVCCQVVPGLLPPTRYEDSIAAQSSCDGGLRSRRCCLKCCCPGHQAVSTASPNPPSLTCLTTSVEKNRLRPRASFTTSSSPGS